MRIILLILSSALIACNATKEVKATAKIQEGNLVGIAQKSDFQKPPFSEWFDENYDSYSLDNETINQLKPLLKGVHIKAVIGTWCSDSQRETPVLYKLLDAADFDYKNLTMITVNRDKVSTNNEQEGLAIERVPTFIFYKDDIEINRFVEYPRETLEKDFLQIVQEVGYKHSYLE